MDKKRKIDNDQEEGSKKIKVESLLNSEQASLNTLESQSSSSRVTQVDSSEEKISSLENKFSEVEKELDDFRNAIDDSEEGTSFSKYLKKSWAESEARKSSYDEAISNATNQAISNSLRIEKIEKSVDHNLNDVTRSLQELPVIDRLHNIILEIQDSLLDQKNDINDLSNLRIDHPQVDSPESQSSSENSSDESSSDESSSYLDRSRGSSLLDDYANPSLEPGDFTGGDD